MRVRGKHSKPPRWPCFLIIDPVGTNLESVAEAIRTLHEDYPWLGFLVLTGEMLPDDPVVGPWHLPHVVRLEPPLEVPAEDDARWMADRLHDLATQYS